MNDLDIPRTWRSRASTHIREVENYLGGESREDAGRVERERSLMGVAITTLLVVGLATGVLELVDPIPGAPRPIVMLGLVVCLTGVVALTRRHT